MPAVQVPPPRPRTDPAATAHEAALRLAVPSFVEEQQGAFSAEQVVAAVARAKTQARHGYLIVFGVAPPPADEYVALVLGLARQELATRGDHPTVLDIGVGRTAVPGHTTPKPQRELAGGWSVTCTCGWSEAATSRTRASEQSAAHKQVAGAAALRPEPA